MSRVEALNRRYAASAALARNGVAIIAIGDPAGARLNIAVRQLLLAARADGPGIWDDLVGASKALRWRSATQPQPIALNPAVRVGADEVIRQVGRLRGGVGNDSLLDQLAAAATVVSESNSTIGGVLSVATEENGPEDCVVVAASRAAQAGMAAWLGPQGIVVLTATELVSEQRHFNQAYAIGPPLLFKASLVTAPMTNEITFLTPAWFGDRSVPRSAMAPFAEGAIQIESRVVIEGDVSAPESEVVGAEEDADVYNEFRPQPEWGRLQSIDREPDADEVEARKLLLCGSLAMWLDDGDRIRALDPSQPVGERVIYADVSAVQAGTYLLLRQGETERGALYRAAMSLLGNRATLIDATQRTWKARLAERLASVGYRGAVRQLRAEDVRTADRARAWIEPNLIRPHSDHDFERLLQWLGVPVQPTFGNATLLRRTLYQASADIREELETAVSAADLSILESTGYLSLDVRTDGFRGIAATCVLAISPHSEIVARHDARVPFEDRSSRWLE